ncbi:hypothetical protein FHS04_002777 [Mesoflavibacter sabulilitoris]|uniref:Conjugative transposon TraM C-terminal domain-containing protein n=1 Tax=Mesoflavibacter zeaxanthinifaciens subsp. sabulilitoris TaxID=1520893 RepID=A0A2T1NNJ9_9FLAO|nr:conjugative transposon protein TraM [Mesoflavibacter zeaxanthinifaciens]MBB3125233.1 hypothetical protein [Mesoflavibacter zeaxanthinifaciens subsp. sabulilitoris]PSG94468.1 hypothetical protein C7H61_00615 [Mesoflavibacter zeaxanthinifaciens subsp. sabulilitoris]
MKKFIVKYKELAIGAPILIIGLIVFLSMSFSDNNNPEKKQQADFNYNQKLPYESKELEESNILEIDKESRRDSLRTVSNVTLNNIGNKKEKDSLSKLLDDLNNFSFDERPNATLPPSSNKKRTNYNSNSELKKQSEEIEKTEQESELEYYNRMLEMKKMQQDNNQDISVNNGTTDASFQSRTKKIKTRAAIYRDQFILPGDRVKMVLTQDLEYNGNIFKKYSPVYAIASINNNRVYLNISNINGIPINLSAQDINDNMLGVYNKRAGELWAEFKGKEEDQALKEIQNTTNSDVSFVDRSIQSIGSFFKSKRLKEKDKILLINDHEVILISSKK